MSLLESISVPVEENAQRMTVAADAGRARQPRIAVICPKFPPAKSGGSDYAFALSKRLAAKGCAVTVITQQGKDGLPCEPNLRICRNMPDWRWSSLPRLLATLLWSRPDVVDIHFTGPIYDSEMITAVPAMLRRLLPRAQIVAHLEYPAGVPIPSGSFQLRVRRLLQLGGAVLGNCGFGSILTHCHRIIALSAVHIETIDGFVRGVCERSVLIPPAPSMEIAPQAAGQTARKDLHLEEGEFVFGYFGYLYPGKGLETLLAAFARIAIPGRLVRLLIIGGENEVMLRETFRTGFGADLKSLAESLGIGDKVIWTGWTTEASRYLRACDVAVLPFDAGVFVNNSSFGAVAAHELPIISTIGESVIEDRRDALLVPPRNEEALSVAMDLLASDPALRATLAEGAAALAGKWYSAEGEAARHLEIYDRK